MHVDIKGELLEAYFFRRVNRFIAEIIIDGKLEIAHVPNTGRMKELLVEGAKVIVRKVNSEIRKTKYDLLTVYHGNILVAIDSRLPNLLLYKGFLENKFSYFYGYREVKKEVTFSNSRFDIGLVGKEKNVLIEAKCVTLVENGLAKFPDAPTKRGKRHLEELIKAKEMGLDAGVFFIIQRSDAESFTPHWEMDSVFSSTLKLAYKNNILVKALICKVEKNSIEIDKEIQVYF